ncbi:YdiU family protein [Brachybacterium sp. FME24]|uniref:protein adenylyltransferase SelO n=1 Tax=Brachybacterium sp. FME24 TaxID=2742605 RepID=UPI001866ED48|nr:protein adenylyltransferase SelO family protein [Brachybacterium sp. FME24]
MDDPVLHQSYAAAAADLSVPWQAETPPDPALAWLNEDLARELGYDPAWLREPAGIALLTGQVDADGHPVPAGGAAPERPFTTAQVYAGHQFGSPNPQLGDGRAVLLGDLLDTTGRRRDLHLKGAGATPFARAGDGRAPLGPMLREAVVGESLHALGVPTTRALAVLTTGEQIAPRQGVTPEPGAILVRVAASHLRVGTVEYAAWHLDLDARRALVQYAAARHLPEGVETKSTALDLLEHVTRAQAELLAQWMLLGFVHGVMNTDNMTLSGEGIDYGPCAFLDEHRSGAVFSSIDRGGRYAYAAQPGIALWNLSRFAETLIQLIDEEDPNAAVEQATAVLEDFEPHYLDAYGRRLAAKLGIPAHGEGADAEHLAAIRASGAELFALLEEQHVDHTGFFRALTDADPAALFADPAPFTSWYEGVLALRGSGASAEAALAGMDRANPVYIPRNVHLEAALRAAHLGDLAPAYALLDAVRRPCERRAELAHLEGPGDGGEHFMTFCGT